MLVLSKTFQDTSTFLLQKLYYEECDLVMKKLMNMPPLSTESMEIILSNLRQMHEELERRDARLVNS